MKQLIAIASLIGLSACASIADGKSQTLSVTSDPSEAKCSLTNDKGVWYVPETPGSVTVNRSVQDIRVECKKAAESGAASVASTTKGMAFGNILFGGIVGVAIDRSNGSGFDYPPQIHVPMKKGGTFVQIGDHYDPEAKEEDKAGAGNPSGIAPNHNVR